MAEPVTSQEVEAQTGIDMKLLPPVGKTTTLNGREKNTAQLRGWCQICGDAAYNRNFGALSCDSCKAFFRRNVNRTPFGRCEGNCEITIESRTFCKKCRFNKCLAVGMKRHLVKGRGMKDREDCQASCDSTADNDVVLRKCSDSEDTIMDIDFQPSLKPEEVGLLMEANVRQPFMEMLNAYNKTYGSYAYDDTSRPQMVEIMNLIEGPLKTLVAFAKNLPRFKALPVEDQISLLKGCAAEAAIIRSSLSYDPTKNGWEVATSNGGRMKVSADILQSDAKEVFHSVVCFYKGVRKVIRGDHILIYMMITLALFSSDREKLIKPEEVQETQQLYASVLQRYCKIRHPQEKNMTARVLMKTTDIRTVGNCAIKLFQSADNDQLRPLLHEIFDLNKREEASAIKSEPNELLETQTTPCPSDSDSNHGRPRSYSESNRVEMDTQGGIASKSPQGREMFSPRRFSDQNDGPGPTRQDNGQFNQPQKAAHGPYHTSNFSQGQDYSFPQHQLPRDLSSNYRTPSSPTLKNPSPAKRRASPDHFQQSHPVYISPPPRKVGRPRKYPQGFQSHDVNEAESSTSYRGSVSAPRQDNMVSSSRVPATLIQEFADDYNKPIDFRTHSLFAKDRHRDDGQ